MISIIHEGIPKRVGFFHEEWFHLCKLGLEDTFYCKTIVDKILENPKITSISLTVDEIQKPQILENILNKIGSSIKKVRLLQANRNQNTTACARLIYVLKILRKVIPDKEIVIEGDFFYDHFLLESDNFLAMKEEIKNISDEIRNSTFRELVFHSFPINMLHPDVMKILLDAAKDSVTSFSLSPYQHSKGTHCITNIEMLIEFIAKPSRLRNINSCKEV